MTNRNGAASFFQRHGVDYKEIHSDFVDELPVKDFDNDLLFWNMAHWADVISKSTSDLLSQGTRAWAKNTIEDRRNAFVPLAKAHITEWLQSADIESATTTYKFTRTCVAMTGQKLLFKKTLESEEGLEFDKEETLALPEAFGDVLKTVNAVWAIAAILNHSGHNDDALKTISGAIGNLDDTPDNSASFKTLVLLATIQGKLEDYDSAQNSITRALARQDGISPDRLRQAHVTQAEIYTGLKESDDAIKSYEQARQANPTELLKGQTLRDEFDAWNKINKAVDLVKNKWTLNERLQWMTWNYDYNESHHDDLMLAAVDANEFDFIVEIYQEIINLLDHFDAGTPLRKNLAYWYYMNGDLESVKKECYAILDSTLNSENGEEYRFTNELTDVVAYNAISLVTDTIYEEFRATADRTVKAKLFAEVKGVMSRPLAHAVALRPSFQVHHKVTLARMARKLGPLYEFEDILNQAFNFVMDALTDDIAWNDCWNLDFLSKVLSCLEGLERDAQIALSARFSQLDPKDQGTAAAGDGAGGEEDEDEDGDPLPEDEGDLTGSASYCAGLRCDVSWRAWKGRRIYFCLYCSDLFLCETCYDKRMDYNTDAAVPHGDNFCGRNHKYLRAVDGWKGIKNGMVLIEGQEPFAFKEWLQELKEKRWREAWEKFWMD